MLSIVYVCVVTLANSVTSRVTVVLWVTWHILQLPAVLHITYQITTNDATDSATFFNAFA